MIKLHLQPEPSDFKTKVEAPGDKFLRDLARPRGKQWKNKDFWCRSIPDMMKTYCEVCAYSSFWIKPDQPTVDHFVSRDEEPKLAYKWKNFRLARWRINTVKGRHKDVLDPFEIGQDWFVLDFSSFEIRPNHGLSAVNADAVDKTIKRLKLNDNDYLDFREAWFNIIKSDPELFGKKAPHLTAEMKRQNII